MADIDRLIEAWGIFRDSNPYEICNGREFRAIKDPEYCMGQMIEDTIVLLKKYEELRKQKQFLVDKCDDLYSMLKKRTGHWIFGNTKGHAWMKCSRCCVSQSGQTGCWSYCPNCGAEMEEEVEHE